MNLIDTILARFANQAQARALEWQERHWSFADLDRWSAAVAAGLASRGIRSGDRVVVGFPNSPELVAAVLGVLRSGALLVPLNPLSSPAEAAYIVADAGAALVITHREQAKALARTASAPIITELPDRTGAPAPLAAPAMEDPALIVYTSGTTGRPKGAVLSHRALVSNLSTVTTAWQWTSDDRLLLTLPCFHLHGLALGLLGSFIVGAGIVMRPRFVAEEVPSLLARNECTMFFGVPTMYNRLVGLPEPIVAAADLRRMRLWVSGSAPLTEATFERFQDRFGHALMNRYGMSECGFVLSTQCNGPRRAGVVGVPLADIDVRLVDPDQVEHGRLVDMPPGTIAEIVIRGPNLFSGYWQRPDESRQAFVADFLCSGDLAVAEPDGQVRIVGRRSVDIIKSRGYKIGAVEIENALQTHPAVAEVAVVGVPDQDQGEAVVAVVTLAPGASASAEELRAFARDHLAPHKVPSRVVLVAQIPCTGPGKFKKRELIDTLAAD